MRYLFILGRNKNLSIKEIEEYLKTNGNPVVKSFQKENGFLVDLEFPVSNNLVNELGGTISMGEVLISCDKRKIINELENKMIYEGTENKLTYALWEFSEMSEEIKEYLKNRFKTEKLKASYKGLTGTVKNQKGKEDLRPSSKLIQEEYFIFGDEENESFGKIIQKCDYLSIEKRDNEKPFHRPSLDISVRLAKILINLAGVKKEETVYDPFCGIGIILQESLILGHSVIGSDIDAIAIKQAKENMKYFNFPEGKYKILLGDSSKIEIPLVKSIVTEPDLGLTLKKIPTKEKAEDMLKKFEKLIISVINNSKNNVSNRIVFTSPFIRIGKKRISCDIEKICSYTGLKIVFDGIEEFRENQIVGRMIYVLEK